jgi:hypothetical protein
MYMSEDHWRIVIIYASVRLVLYYYCPVLIYRNYIFMPESETIE